MWPFLQGMIESMLVDGMDYVIEGEAMLPELVADLVENMIAYSKMIKNGCEKYGLPCIDTSEDFLGATEAATALLTGHLK